jgi:hypothetical protein
VPLPASPGVRSTAAPAAVDETPSPEDAAKIAASTVFEPDEPTAPVAVNVDELLAGSAQDEPAAAPTSPPAVDPPAAPAEAPAEKDEPLDG